MANPRVPEAVPGDQRELILVHESVENARIIHIFDDVDLINAAQLDDEAASVADGRPIVIELSLCNAMDSAGTRALTRAFDAYGDRLRIVVAPGTGPERILAVTGLYRRLPVVASLDEALRPPLTFDPSALRVAGANI